MDAKNNRMTLLNKHSINMHVFAFELILITLGILMLLVIYFNFATQMKKQKIEYIQAALSQKSYSIHHVIEEIGETMVHATYNRDVIDLLRSRTNSEIFEYSRSVDEYVVQLKILESNIDNIIFYNDDISYNGGYNPSYNSKIAELSSQISSSSAFRYLGFITHDESGTQLIFGNSVYDAMTSLDQIGQMIFVINSRLIEELLYTEVGEIVLVDDDMTIIMAQNEEIVGTTVKVDDNTYITEKHIHPEMPFYVIAKNYEVDISHSILQISVTIIIIAVLIVAILFISYMFIKRNVVCHLKRINHFIHAIGQGDFRNLKKRLKITGAREICEISEAINNLLDELNSRTVRLVNSTSHLYEAEISKKEAELNYIKSQINPHFLYNTLNVVKGIASINNQKEIEEITLALVKIFRYSIKGEEFVQLCQELDIVKAYIQIQMIRFEDSFEVTFDIEEHLLETEILKMVLQPILENAIQHGVEGTYEKNHILIAAYETENYIKLIVEDDGIGMTHAQLQEIKDALDQSELNILNRYHIGILNVHHRLKHYYGATSGVFIDSRKGEGTKVTILIDSSYLT